MGTKKLGFYDHQMIVSKLGNMKDAKFFKGLDDETKIELHNTFKEEGKEALKRDVQKLMYESNPELKEQRIKKFSNAYGLNDPTEVTTNAINSQNMSVTMDKIGNFMGMLTMDVKVQAQMAFYNAQVSQNFIKIAQQDETIKQNNTIVAQNERLIEQNDIMIELMKQMANK